MRPRALIASGLLLFTQVAVAAIPSPEEFLGRRPGEDRYLAPWTKVVEYFDLLGDSSPRVTIEDAGTSTLGHRMPLAVITTEANQKRLGRFREIARRLADPDSLPPQEAEPLIAEGKAIVLVTCSIHSTEVGSTQMAMGLAHELATTRDPELLAWLDEVILLLMPSINPDGQVMVVDWYNQYLDTEFEGGRMPWLYHHYVGHDDNRDFYMLTQQETRVVNEVAYRRWFPQVFLDEHQMGSTGPRMFVPPQTDPLDPEVHPLIFRQADLLGTAMALDLEEAGKTGVGSDMIFDSYWPGATRNTAWWKNVTGLLTEVASARIATPIYVDPSELSGGGKGLPEYKRQANFPSPWPGGWWRLSDIMQYERIATLSLLEAVGTRRSEFLRNFYEMGREAVAAGRSQAPYAFLIPPEQHDPTAAGLLVELLLRHGVQVQEAREPFAIGRSHFPAGTTVIPAAQPYRAFLLTMLRPQRYPEIRPYREGPVIPPYDSTTWSLPISMGVEVVEAEAPIEARLENLEAATWPRFETAQGAAAHVIPRRADSAYTAANRLLAEGARVLVARAAGSGFEAGDFVVPSGAVEPERLDQLADELHLPIKPVEHLPVASTTQHPVRVGLYKPWVASMDEGWTRFLLERYEFPLTSLDNAAMKDGSYAGEVDVVLLPDVSPAIIKTGEPTSERARYWWSPLPPEYAGGIGSEGDEALKEWVVGGGTVAALNESSEYLIELLQLPVDNVLTKVSRAEFSCPGSALRLLVDTSHPLGWGMQREDVGYSDGSQAFQTRLPDGDIDRTVVARYPDDRRDILVSGYLVGAEVLERRAAVVEFEVGKGRVVLIGFKPQNRAQTHRTFKLLFNALLRPGLETQAPPGRAATGAEDG